MPKFNFTATHGVEFADSVGEEKAYKRWASFTRERDLDTAEGEKVYTFGTDDPKVAERLRGVNDYGITEVKAAPSRGVEPEGE